MYARDLYEGFRQLSFTQLRTPFFPFFMDVDVKCGADAEFEKADMARLVEVALGAVRDFCPGRARMDPALLRAYVTHTLPATLPGGKTKHGAHIHVPAMVLDADTARLVRERVLQRAIEAFPDGSPYNPFSDIYDQAVYVANGLRMIGSVKMTPCEDCRQQDAECSACGGYGKTVDMTTVVDDQTGETVRRGRVYQLARVLRYDPATDAHVEDAPELARLSVHTIQAIFESISILSVRTPDTMVDWIKVPSGIQMPQLVVPKTKRAPKSEPTRVYELYPEDVAGTNKHISNSYEVESAATLATLERVINEVVIPADRRRAGMQLRRALYNTVDEAFILYVRGPGATVCANKPGDGRHRSNSVYFVVAATGVTQRCFCMCTGVERERVQGILCKKFRHRLSHLPPDLRSALFPLIALEEDRVCLQHESVRLGDDQAQLLSGPLVAVNPMIDVDADGGLVAPRQGLVGPLGPHRTQALKRRPASDNARQQTQKRLRLFSMAIQAELTRGPVAKKTKVTKMDV